MARVAVPDPCFRVVLATIGISGPLAERSPFSTVRSLGEVPAGGACGAAVATPTAVCNVRRYRCHGGGPALGALYSAVYPSPATDTQASRRAVDGRHGLQVERFGDSSGPHLENRIDAAQGAPTRCRLDSPPGYVTSGCRARW